jgi:outer membrane receptor protein involved in Fe transport
MGKGRRVLSTLGWLAVFAARPVMADDAAPADITQISLEDLLNTQVTVADREGDTLREASGIVTVITRDEIISSGARDLVDVLMQVPGFSFGTDVEGVVGIAFRGTWSIDGKVMLMIDGQPMNERLYADVLLGNHYPVDQIQRIEIIRGPGSAIYGGFAELAVINVITRSAEELSGAEASISYGRNASTFARRNISFAFGQKLANEVSISGFLLLGQGHRTDATFTDIYGSSANLAHDNRLDPAFFDLGLGYKGARFRLIIDDYHLTSRDGNDALEARSWNNDFKSTVADFQYDVKASDRVTITPRVSFRQDTPWNATEPGSPYIFDVTNLHYFGSALADADLGHGLHAVGGGEGFVDDTTVSPRNMPYTIPGVARGGSLQFEDVAALAQVTWKTSLANFIVGAREEYHSEYGASFVPRVGVTRVLGKLHAKLLLSRAFRAPAMANFFYQSPPALSPERTTVAEAEVGYQPNDHTFLVANVFQQKLQDAIIYFYDANGNQGYSNYSSTATQGIELDLRARYTRWNADLNYSFYTANGNNKVTTWDVPGQPDVLLGTPQHKVAATASVTPIEGLPVRITPTVVFMSKRYGYDHLDAMGNPLITQFPSITMANVFVEWRDAFVKNLDVGVGAYNILGNDFRFIEPYNGYKAPLNGLDREVMVRLTYGLRMKP